jgi:hypothetical protein
MSVSPCHAESFGPSFKTLFNFYSKLISKQNINIQNSTAITIEHKFNYTHMLKSKAGERGEGQEGGQNTWGPECSEGPGNLGKMFHRLSSLYVCPK